MVKLLRYCALGVGTLLILLAALLAVRVKSTLTPTTTNHVGRAEVALAVSELQSGCFTCHTVLNDMPTPSPITSGILTAQLELSTYAVRQLNHDVPVALSNAQVHRELTALGQRILKLPTAIDSNPGFVQASVEFVQLYEQAQTATHHTLVTGILQGIADMDDLLRTLKNQALPYTVRANNLTTIAPHAAAAHQSLARGVGPVALFLVIVLAEAGSAAAPLVDRTPSVRTQDMIFAVRRHGPPADMGVFSDSVCNGRLPSDDVQSPFILLAAVPHQAIAEGLSGVFHSTTNFYAAIY